MKIGDTFTVKKVVTEDMTAAALGSGGLPVFGTPYLVVLQLVCHPEHSCR